jgi:hypothetical protein
MSPDPNFLPAAASLGWSERSSTALLEAFQEHGAADRPANRLRPAQPPRRLCIFASRDQRGEVRIARRHLRRRGQSVIGAELRVQARPGPIRGAIDQPRPHRVERDIAKRRAQML